MHHIKKKDRRRILRELFRVLKPSGRLVIFEHNTLNPVTRKLVNECPFDVDAILITPIELTEYLTGRTFSVQGRNLHGYKNVNAVPVGDVQ